MGNLPDLLEHSLTAIFTSQDGDNTKQSERGGLNAGTKMSKYENS